MFKNINNKEVLFFFKLVRGFIVYSPQQISGKQVFKLQMHFRILTSAANPYTKNILPNKWTASSDDLFQKKNLTKICANETKWTLMDYLPQNLLMRYLH